MSPAAHLFFPCLDPHAKTTALTKENYRSSALIHAVTSLALGLLLAAVASVATYYGTAGIVGWTAGGGALAGIITMVLTYAGLRCALGQTEEKPPRNQPTIKSSKIATQSAKRPTVQKPTQKSTQTSTNTNTTNTQPARDWTGYLIETVVPIYPGDLTSDQANELNIQQLQSTHGIQIEFDKNQALKVMILQQDMRESGAQVLVNAANTPLHGGSGIDRDIHKWGGEDYKKEHQGALKERYAGGFKEGYAAMIGSGDMGKDKVNGKPNTHIVENVIVVAGPLGKSTPEKESQLYSCYYNSLVLAHNHNKTSIAFPGISTGLFGFPKERAAKISLRAIYDFSKNYPNSPLKTISIHYLKPNEGVKEAYEAAV